MKTTVDTMESVALLRRAVVDPFFILNRVPYEASGARAFALWDWAEHLRRSFPLWCFQPSAYAGLNHGDLPTTHPLAIVVRSIVEDEASEDSPTRLLSLKGVEGLALVLDSRRCGLSLDEPRGGVTDSVEEDGGEFRLIGSFGVTFSRLLDGPLLANYEADTEFSEGGYASPYEEIGLRLVQLVEARDAARPGSMARRAAGADLKRFLGGVAIQSRGRPTDLRVRAVRRLAEEGERLVRLTAGALAEPIEPSESTREVLAAFGVPTSGMVEWALRLALPVFSQVELAALRREVDSQRKRGNAGGKFPREFAVQLLAHRFHRPVSAIARKSMTGWMAELMGTHGGRCGICGRDHGG